MNERDFESLLHDLFETVGYGSSDPGELPEVNEDFQEAFQGCTVRSFHDAGIMTSNKGLVVKTADGQEFQLTIVG